MSTGPVDMSYYLELMDQQQKTDNMKLKDCDPPILEEEWLTKLIQRV